MCWAVPRALAAASWIKFRWRAAGRSASDARVARRGASGAKALQKMERAAVWPPFLESTAALDKSLTGNSGFPRSYLCDADPRVSQDQRGAGGASARRRPDVLIGSEGGSSVWVRTTDPRINSPLLCELSYRGRSRGRGSGRHGGLSRDRQPDERAPAPPGGIFIPAV